MNKFKKILSWIFSFAMIFNVIPITRVVAQGEQKKIMLGTNGIESPTEDVNVFGKKQYIPNSYIYFGKYKEHPNKWRVLDAQQANNGDKDGMFLLSEYLLDEIYFNMMPSNEYSDSYVRKWCREFEENTSNFSVLEQNAILEFEKEYNDANEAGQWYGFDWGRSTLNSSDKMFLLSVSELAKYVGDYNGASQLMTTYDPDYTYSGMWWLRSPYYTYINNNYAGCVTNDGYVCLDYVFDNNYGVRPAFNLNLNSVLFTSDAVGGKISGDAGADAISKIEPTTSKERKLTVIDTNREFDVKTCISEGNTLIIEYENAATGPNEFISVIIADETGEDALYYGRLLKLEPGQESGTVTMEIPELSLGTYTLKFFNEQCNGDLLTDYSSEFQDVTLILE